MKSSVEPAMFEAIQNECAACATPIAGTFARCEICVADLCLVCGSTHLCGPTCQANGCIPGRCVQVVIDGVRSPRWGVPEELLPIRPPDANSTD